MCCKHSYHLQHFTQQTLKKQKVTLAQVFDKITIATLNLQGSVETTRFVTLVLWVRKWFNLKYPKIYCMLFVKDRKPFAKASDRRLPYLKSSAKIFESMDTYSVSSKTRILWLTTNIDNALHSTLNRFITLIVFFLTKIKCVLAA